MNEQSYFEWLYSRVASRSNPNPQRTFWLLLEEMHKKRFSWCVPNDDNRVEDGLELRCEYLNGPLESEHYCTFLEMLIALSRRVAFESMDDDPMEWFWHLVANLGLRELNDEALTDRDLTLHVRNTLDIVVDRRYDKDGHGGLFPLDKPEKDQRKVELWYQMSSYLLEGKGP